MALRKTIDDPKLMLMIGGVMAGPNMTIDLTEEQEKQFEPYLVPLEEKKILKKDLKDGK